MKKIRPVVRKLILREWSKHRAFIPELGEHHVLCNWIMPEDDPTMIDMQNYSKLLTLLPDKIVNNLEKARLERAGVVPSLKMGLGYEECISSVIVDGTAVTNVTENILFPNLLLPANYLQPNGIPGRTIHSKARGRVTNVVTTPGTCTFRMGAATTNATTVATAWCKSGAIVLEATTVTTAGMWEVETSTVVRSVGSGGTVFAMGDADLCCTRFASAAGTDKPLQFMGSAGPLAPATVACDMTVPQYKILTVQWSVATATGQGHQYIVEAMN
jgi:hypothetical protein